MLKGRNGILKGQKSGVESCWLLLMGFLCAKFTIHQEGWAGWEVRRGRTHFIPGGSAEIWAVSISDALTTTLKLSPSCWPSLRYSRSEQEVGIRWPPAPWQPKIYYIILWRERKGHARPSSIGHGVETRALPAHTFYFNIWQHQSRNFHKWSDRWNWSKEGKNNPHPSEGTQLIDLLCHLCTKHLVMRGNASWWLHSRQRWFCKGLQCKDRLRQREQGQN